MIDVRTKIRNIFTEVQNTKRNHPKYLSKLRALYKSTDERVFAEEFIMCLVVPMHIGEKHPRVENTLEFAAKFAVSIKSINSEAKASVAQDKEENEAEEEEEEEELCPFLSKLFDFLLSNHDVADPKLRFGICYFTNMLLNSMGDNAFIDDALCDRITTNMTERLLDKVPRVRAQAIFALQRLQDPADENCPVIKAFIFHMSKDPQAEVRRAVLVTIGRNKQSLAAALKRTRDINVGVRKLAYQFLSKITVRSLKIAQREQLLSDGLRDRAENVSNFVKTKFLPTWLEHYNGEFIKLLRALDSENSLTTCTLMLEVLFKSVPLREIVQQVPVDEDTKLIPFDNLSSESVIYWRCTIEHLHREECQDELCRILPDLLKFCEYIREFIKIIDQGNREHWEQQTLKFILLQLFEITKTYDLSDEVGRDKLKDLILDTLKSDNDSETLIDCVVQQFVAVVPDTETRLNLLADVISELRMPLTTENVPISEDERHERVMKKAKLTVVLLQAEEEQYDAVKNKDFLQADQLNKKIKSLKEQINELATEPTIEDVQEENVLKDDEVTLSKCLQIMYSMMQSVKTLCPLSRSLFESMVLPNLDHAAARVTVVALKAMTVCCMLDEKFAKMHLPGFFVQFSIENDNIWLAALKGIFDLLVLYGLERLGMSTNQKANESEIDANKSRKNKSVRLFRQSEANDMPTESTRQSIDNSNTKDIINILTGLLDNVNQDLRTIAVEGLCKLLLHRRIFSANLVSRLIILWHNPVTDDDTYLRQCLSYFFNNFARLVPDSLEMMERAFLPTLKILANAPDTSPLQEIEPTKVTQLLLYLTKSSDHNGPLAYCPHNNLALAMIAEALNTESKIDPGVMIRSLKYLVLNLEDESTRKCLQEAVEKLLAKVDYSDRRTINSIMHFKRNLYENVENVEPREIEEEDEEEEVAIDEDDSDIGI